MHDSYFQPAKKHAFFAGLKKTSSFRAAQHPLTGSTEKPSRETIPECPSACLRLTQISSAADVLGKIYGSPVGLCPPYPAKDSSGPATFFRVKDAFPFSRGGACAGKGYRNGPETVARAAARFSAERVEGIASCRNRAFPVISPQIMRGRSEKPVGMAAKESSGDKHHHGPWRINRFYWVLGASPAEPGQSAPM